jgi:hypothetical protein
MANIEQLNKQLADIKAQLRQAKKETRSLSRKLNKESNEDIRNFVQMLCNCGNIEQVREMATSQIEALDASRWPQA